MTQQSERDPAQESPVEIESISMTSLNKQEEGLSANEPTASRIPMSATESITEISADQQECTVSEEPKLQSDLVVEQNEDEPNLDKVGKGESGRQKWNDSIQALWCCTLCACCFNQWAACFEIISECV